MRRMVWMVAVVLVLMLAQWAEACPTCKDSMANGANSANLVRGFGWSVIFMMSAPFLILTGLASYFYYEVRKARAAQAAQSAAAIVSSSHVAHRHEAASSHAPTT